MNGPEAARSIREVLEEQAEPSEQARTLSQPAVDALWDSGLMTYLNPTAAGGSEPCFRELIETWIELASADGSAGWTGIANLPTTMAAAAYLPDGE